MWRYRRFGACLPPHLQEICFMWEWDQTFLKCLVLYTEIK